MSDDAASRWRRAVANVVQDLMNRGEFLEAGWQAWRRLALTPDVQGHALELYKEAYFAGASILWGGMSQHGLDEGAEPAEADVARLELVQKQIDEFDLVLRLKYSAVEGQA